MASGEDDPALERTAASGDAPSAELATLDASAGPSIAAPAEALPEVAASRYEMAGEVGRGGLGRVLRARDRVLQRTVAVKELLGGGDEARRRFVRETLITARLQHPSIIPVYEAGRWRDRSPFYAMKLVAGRPLADAIAEARTLEARLALLPAVLAVADAMAYAHGERIIHRDLKPGNVLVGAYGETVVIDWGLAKDLSIEDRDAVDAGPFRTSPSDQTVAGAVLGTPAYMAPEQAAGGDVDERADVYALGAMLYHAISGSLAHEGKTLDEVIRRVLAGDLVPLARREPRAPADLVAIVGKAMALRPEDRYPTAKELAEDLRRFQTGQLVGAHRYTLGQRVRRWLRRNRAVAIVGAIALAVLLAYGTWSIRALVEERARADRERDEARVQRDEAIANGNVAVIAQARGALARDPAEALAWLRRLDVRGPGWDAARVIAADALARPHKLRELGGPEMIVHPVLALDGSRVANLGERSVWIADLRDGRTATFDATGERAALCADGRLVFRGRSPEGTVEIDLDRGVSSRAEDLRATLAALARCTPRAAYAIDAGELLWWDAAAGRLRAIDRVAADSHLLVAHDGHWARVQAADGTTRWWRDGALARERRFDAGARLSGPIGGERVVVLSGKRATLVDVDRARTIPLAEDAEGAATSPDVERIAILRRGSIAIHDGVTGAEVDSFDVDGPQFASFSPDGRWIGFLSDDGPHVADLEGATTPARLPGLATPVGPVIFLGDQVLTIGNNAGKMHVQSWSLTPLARVSVDLPTATVAGDLARSADGSVVVSVADDGTLQVRRGGVTTTVATVDADNVTAAVSHDGAAIAWSTSGGVGVLELASGRSTTAPSTSDPYFASGDVVFSDDDRTIVAVETPFRVRIQDRASGEARWVDVRPLHGDNSPYAVTAIAAPPGKVIIETTRGVFEVPDDLPRAPAELAARLLGDPAGVGPAEHGR